MADEYRSSYGVTGQVLYPPRAKDCPSFDREPKTYRKEAGQLVGAFAGNIYDAGYARLILTLAECLDARGGKLLLFVPQSTSALRSLGLDLRNVFSQGLVEAKELIARLSNEADFVFVPMAFASREYEQNMRLAFPSKLTDYTATGLPLLICGPECCSAVRWARANTAAEIVSTQTIEALGTALDRLEDASYRERLGRAASEAGDRCFSHRGCVAMLHQALLCVQRPGQDSTTPFDARHVPSR